jgi:signal peptidase II
MSDSQLITVARRPKAIWLFAVLSVLFLGLDLGSKSWAFHSVAPVPVRVTAGEKGPEIRTQTPLGAWEIVDKEHPERMVPHESKVVIPKVLNLHLLTNQGAVFGIGQGQRALFIGISALALAAIAWYLLTSPANAYWMHAGLALILAGALGNLFDRIAYKGVRDMLHLLPGVELPFGLSWPGGVREAYPWIFNVADVELIAGVGLLLVISWFSKPHKKADDGIKN